MSDIQKLTLEDLEHVTGGVTRYVDTGTSDKAAIRSGPSKTARQIASLANGAVVDTIGQSVYDPASGRNFVQISFTDRGGQKKIGWIAASIVGLPR